MSSNDLSGPVPKSFALLKYLPRGDLDVSHNVLTGDATPFVDKYGLAPFEYNCFDPAVPPANPLC
jgi:hypothetical protein